jgi:hypothetical protein
MNTTNVGSRTHADAATASEHLDSKTAVLREEMLALVNNLKELKSHDLSKLAEREGMLSREVYRRLDDLDQRFAACVPREADKKEFIARETAIRTANRDYFSAVEVAQRGQEKAVVAALDAREKAIISMMEAVERAAGKSETVAENLFESAKEFHALLSDRAVTFLPRAEFDRVTSAIADKIEASNKSFVDWLDDFRTFDMKQFGQFWHRRLLCIIAAFGCCLALFGTDAVASSVSLTYGSGSNNVSYQLTYTGAPARKQLFLDTDRNAGTGYPISGTGADYLVQNGTLYRYSGSGGSWVWTAIKSVAYTDTNNVASMTIARADIGNPSAIDLIGAATGDGTTAKITQVITFIAPALVNPVSPVQFGAKCDGVTDDSAAFQSAVKASDVKVPSGTCVINHPVTVSISNRHIECSAGTTLKQTDGFAGQMFVFGDWGNPYTGDSVVNCNFLGANTVAPQYYDNDARHWDIPIETTDKVSNFFLAGNTFKQFFGQSMFQTYGTVDGGSGDVIEYNTFASCGYYGPVFTAHKNGYIGHNTLTDCALGVENDNTTQIGGNNIIEYNTLTGVYGYGAPDMNAAVMLTGGAAGGANYSTNIVRNNTVSGTSSRTGFHSEIYEHAPGGTAQYLNNTCGTGCVTIQ